MIIFSLGEIMGYSLAINLLSDFHLEMEHFHKELKY